MTEKYLKGSIHKHLQREQGLKSRKMARYNLLPSWMKPDEPQVGGIKNGK